MSCCVVPLALFALGVSGAWIANLTQLAPYQPYRSGTPEIHPKPTDHAIWNGGMVTINSSVLGFRRRNSVGVVSSISLADNVRDTFGPYFRGVLAIGWNFAMIASLKRY